MIITLPRNVNSLKYVTSVPKENPIVKLVPKKNELAVFDKDGKQVGRLGKEDGTANAAIADFGCVRVKKSADGIRFVLPEEPAENCGYDCSLRKETAELVFFGKAETAQYCIYRRRKGEVQPDLLAQAVAHPLKDEAVNVMIPDGEDEITAIMLCLAVGCLK